MQTLFLARHDLIMAKTLGLLGRFQKTLEAFFSLLKKSDFFFFSIDNMIFPRP